MTTKVGFIKGTIRMHPVHSKWDVHFPAGEGEGKESFEFGDDAAAAMRIAKASFQAGRRAAQKEIQLALGLNNGYSD